MEIEKNDKIKVHYTGKLEGGEVFDTSEGKDPLEFTVGVGMVIPGFDNAVVGMKEGEEKTIEIESDQAYGPRMDQLVQEVPKDQVPVEAKEGMMLQAQTPEGQQIPVKVVEVTEDKVKLDMNHPLAGKKLIFEVKVEGITKGEDVEEEEECGPSCGSCSTCK